MDKSQEEQQVEKKIGQLQNRQKILLNKKRSEEHRARTHRLIGRGAILEGVFPVVVEMEGEEVKAFLIALSRLPGACCVLRTRWGLRPQTPAPPPESDTRCASVTFRRGQYPALKGGAFLRQFFIVPSKLSSGARASPLWPLPPIGAAKSW